MPVVHEAWARRCWDDMQAKMKQAKRNLPKECTDDGDGGIDVPVTLAPVGPFLSKPSNAKLSLLRAQGRRMIVMCTRAGSPLRAASFHAAWTHER